MAVEDPELRCNWRAVSPNVASCQECAVGWVDGVCILAFSRGGDYAVETSSLLEALFVAEAMLLKWD